MASNRYDLQYSPKMEQVRLKKPYTYDKSPDPYNDGNMMHRHMNYIKTLQRNKSDLTRSMEVL